MKPGDDEETEVIAQTMSRDAEFLNVWLMNSSSLKDLSCGKGSPGQPIMLVVFEKVQAAAGPTSACQTADSAHFSTGQQ